MIEVKVKSLCTNRDLISVKCQRCSHTRIYEKHEFEEDGYNKCISCGCLLPDVEALVYNVDYRITYNTRHSEHFVR